MKTMFTGLKVLDLSSVLAGPSVAMFFAECGADVIKIENAKNGGDVTRSWKLPQEDPSQKVSAYFSSINYHKTYQWLDLGLPENRNLLTDMIRASDIVIINFKKGDDQKFHVSWDEIHAINPRTILGQITGYSSTESRVAYDVVLQAECGFMYLNGNAQSGPMKMPVAMIDMLAAHQLKEGILCALLNREKTGQGSHVVCSLEKAGIAALSNQASNFLMTSVLPQPSGLLNPNIAPYGEIVKCLNEEGIVLAVGSDRQFHDLCSILGDAKLAESEKFSTNQERLKHRDELFNALQSLASTHSRDELLHKFIEKNVPAGAIKTMAEVFQSETARNMVLEEKIEEINTRRVSTVAFEIYS